MAIVSSFLNLIKRIIPSPIQVPRWIKRAVVNPVVSAMRRGLHSVDDILETVESSGAVPEGPRFGKDLKRLVKMVDLEAGVRNWDRNKVLPTNLMVEADLPQGRRYRLDGIGHFMNNETGEMREQTVSMYDNVRRTPQEYEDEFWNAYRKNYEANETLMGIVFEHVVHSPGKSY